MLKCDCMASVGAATQLHVIALQNQSLWMTHWPCVRIESMSAIGIKEITLENWLMPDIISVKLITGSASTRLWKVTVCDLYVRTVVAIRLSSQVPVEVRRAFEVAKGAMVYGYFFYPLFTIGLEHLYKVAEIAVKVKCAAIDPKQKVDKLGKGIKRLASLNILDKVTEKRWHALSGLRNSASHPSGQTIVTPAMAMRMLKPLADDLEKVFRG